MRSASAVKRPVASFNPGGVENLSRKKGSIGGEAAENAEVVDDLSSLKAECDIESVGYESQAAASIANFGCKSFAGAWKPVIDGKIQPLEPPNSATDTITRNWTSESNWTNSSSRHGSDRPSVSNISGSSDMKKDDEGNDSDSDIRRVPELPEKSSKGRSQKLVGGSSSSRRRSGGSSNDKEGKRLKRLLRNRVSAQQARERKKAYLVELEQKAKDLETRNAELEEKNATLQRENYMLRQIVKNTTIRGGGD
ncbi:hypothetical protein SELMODRAFT_451326 [Selaginella moellendorffii]|uniref:Uncharacterized protein HY5A-2 n=1 Tax=Selaginella moellendorffii TaxID=88036 RepID=D8SPA7_SELML|nr:transcription factor HY5 [Selaginella moellendorffii]EFJ13750.1 hypothetical protein SELMODRAFT_451326 [Selaginella moellendorffii]|eukprot:XP_002985256.1 transcription factor HY5 [Selaginella moellendorffii]